MPPLRITSYNVCYTKLLRYEADFGEIIGLDVTFDGGQTWEALWENPLGLLNIPQNEFTYYFNTPSSATEMQFAFRFEGNNYAINLWAIDDIESMTVLKGPNAARNNFV